MYEAKTILWTLKEGPAGPALNDPEKVYALCKDMQNLAQESMHILALNTKNKLIDRFLVALGHINGVSITPREVFRWAIISNAAAIIIVHNHPSGVTDPSEADIGITRHMINAGKILGISVLDHIIIGDRYYSFYRRQPELWRD